MRWAAVLPVPVCAWPATSRPASAIGSALLWIGVQYVKPASLMPACSSGASENSENLSSVKCSDGAEAVVVLDSSACKLTSQGVKIGHQARTLAFPNPLVLPRASRKATSCNIVPQRARLRHLDLPPWTSFRGFGSRSSTGTSHHKPRTEGLKT